jgi:hypothetical protein
VEKLRSSQVKSARDHINCDVSTQLDATPRARAAGEKGTEALAEGLHRGSERARCTQSCTMPKESQRRAERERTEC